MGLSAWYSPLQFIHLNKWEHGFLCFVSSQGGVCFGVCPAAPSHVIVMFKLIRPTVFGASHSVCSVCKGGVPPFPAVSVLGNTWVHVCASNSSDVLTYIDAPVDN